MSTYDFIGVDIAKDTFDAVMMLDHKSEHKVFDNQNAGFKQFAKWLNKFT